MQYWSFTRKKVHILAFHAQKFKIHMHVFWSFTHEKGLNFGISRTKTLQILEFCAQKIWDYYTSLQKKLEFTLGPPCIRQW